VAFLVTIMRFRKNFRILKFYILRVPSIQISPKKGKNLGIQEPEKILKVLKYDTLREYPIQITTKKGKNNEFC
jgi:hypothetical protein